MDATHLSASGPIINITGNKVALGPWRHELLPLYLRWINDWEVTRTWMPRLAPRTLEAQEAIYERISKGSEDIIDLTVYERSTLRPIGYTVLEDIRPRARTATFHLLIGEKECWGQGYGTETTILMLDYGFTLLGLHNIHLTVDSFNERAIRAYTRAGFRVYGRRREARPFGGQVYDTIYMDCLATEFQSSSPAFQRLLPDR
jgi:RimJ/RimL family protein N-acetyltransferase